METKHTPGPWQASYKRKYDEWNVNVPAADSITMRIALFDEGGVPGDTPEEREANARLIAAAPEMLRAIRWACEQLAQLSTGEDWPEQVEDIIFHLEAAADKTKLYPPF